jgi:hypothetical protein
MMRQRRWPTVFVAAVVALSGCSAKPNELDHQRIATMKADQILRDYPNVRVREGFYHGANMVSGEPTGNDTVDGTVPLTPRDVYRRTAAILGILRAEGWIVLYTFCEPQFVDYPPGDDTALTTPYLESKGYRNIDGVSYVYSLNASASSENRLKSWIQLEAPFHEDVTDSFPDAPTGLTPAQTCIESGNPDRRTPQTDGTVRDLTLSVRG